MLENLPIGKKIGLGFGAVLILLVAVGAISYTGVGGIVTNATEVITGNRLDGTLAQHEVDHLKWANEVSSLLTDENVTELTVQTDDHKCGFGEWLYGDDRKHAEAAVPSIAPILKRIEEHHKIAHKSAIDIGDQYRQPHAGLVSTLSNRWADHKNWVGQCATELSKEGNGLFAYQTLTRNAVDQAYSIIVNCAEDDTYADDEARKQAAMKIIKATRYGPESKDYFWINDKHPTMVMHPYKPQLDGKDLSGSADPNGKKLFVEMVKACKSGGQGYVTYEWPKPGSDQPVPKLSYVRLYEPWGWIVGTGVFLDETNKDLLARADDFAAGRPFKLGVQVDPTKCAFGKFLADPHTAAICAGFPEFKTAIDACRSPHEHLHKSAISIEKHVTDLDFDTAMDVFQNQTQTILAGLKTHFDTAVAAETKLGEGAAAANAIYASQTKPNLEHVLTLLRDVRGEVKANILTDDAMLATAESTKRNVSIVGAIAMVVGLILAFYIARSVTNRLKRIIEGLNEGASQVNDAAVQVSSASQSLAEGASEQASSLEETSSALEEMAAMTRTNAENAKQANELSDQAKTAAESGDRTMKKLNTAMTGINESSGQISKIIKVIEEIAFQTNLLALNAAVEAARAGEHGKGFAVVADEVRNLAQRAAEAARETTGLIEDSVNKAKEGTDVASEVGNALGAIVADVTKVSDLISGITKASDEQAQGVDQVNSAVSQMDKVTQQSAAGAEESASASEELAAQAQAVKGMVNELAAMAGGRRGESDSPAPAPASNKKHNVEPGAFGQHANAAAKRPVAAAAPTPVGSPEDLPSFNDDPDGMNAF